MSLSHSQRLRQRSGDDIMKAVTADEMRGLEKRAIDAGISARILMEIAGLKLATIALHEVKKARTAWLVCGRGGNGGDGLVAARHLFDAGLDVKIFLTGPEKTRYRRLTLKRTST